MNTVIGALTCASATRQPDAIALLAPGRSSLTYADLWSQVQYVAGVLRSQGVTSSTRIAVVLPERTPDAVSSVAAIAPCLPLNPSFQAAEYRSHLVDMRVQVVMLPKGDQGPLRSDAGHGPRAARG